MSYKKQAKINAQLFDNSKDTIVELFEISQIPNTDDVIRFQGGINNMNTDIFFGGETYVYIPYEGNDFSTRADGSMGRPRLKLFNHLGYFSKYILDKDDMIKAKVTRIRTFVRYLDKENFVNYEEDIEYWRKVGVHPDPTATLRQDVWYINQKSEENKNFIEYELANALDLEGVHIPKRRVINNYCSWKYRGKNCNYLGVPCADGNNVKFTGNLVDRGTWVENIAYNVNDYVFMITYEAGVARPIVFVATVDHTSSSANRPSSDSKTWVRDECAKNLLGCKLRFEGTPNDPLRFGGFPSSRLF